MQGGSNPWPQQCKCCALPLSYAPFYIYLIYYITILNFNNVPYQITFYSFDFLHYQILIVITFDNFNYYLEYLFDKSKLL